MMNTKAAFAAAVSLMSSAACSQDYTGSEREIFQITCTGPSGSMEIVQGPDKTVLHGVDVYGDKTIGAASFVFEFKEALNYATAHCYQGGGIDSIEAIGFEPSLQNIRMDAQQDYWKEKKVGVKLSVRHDIK